MITVKQRSREFSWEERLYWKLNYVKAMHVSIWQRFCLHFSYVLRLSVKLNLKVAD